MNPNSNPSPAGAPAPASPTAAPSMGAPSAGAPVTAPPGRRKRALLTLTAVVVVLGGAWVGYDLVVASRYESTENAYVQSNLVQITPQMGGTVTAILVDDTDHVKAGQPLVRLDPADAKVALQQAEAALAQAVRQARTVYANNGSLSAQVALRQAEVARVRNEVVRAGEDLQRRQALAGSGAVSREELRHAEAQLSNAREQLASAEAAVLSAREQLVSNQALTEGTPVESHPAVQAAAGRVREAWLATQRLALPAPVEGYVARRSVQLGQRVAAGTPLMTIVPLNQVWVEANFKEVQLRKLRIGQPVTLTADLYGQQVSYHGQVAGLGVGTGAAFALLPAQNATGNWIKVVQRVPVRVALDAKEIAAHPLRVGLSMHAEVDVTRQDGKLLDERAEIVGTQTQALAIDDAGGEALVRQVIAANLGPSPRGAAMRAAKVAPAATAAASR